MSRFPQNDFRGTVHRDVPYLEAERTERLDAYLPDSRVWPDPYPVVIVIHGGGWVMGDKADRRQVEIAEFLTGHGYAALAINYRLNEFSDGILKGRVTRSCWPDCLNDCRESLRFVSERAGIWNLDATRIALFGLSAGAHLALLTGLTTGHAELDRLCGRFPVACVISFYGVYDLESVGEKWGFGESHADPGAIRRLASPANHLSPGAPPTFVVHSRADATVPVAQSMALVEKLRAHGVPHRTRIVESAPHGFGIRSVDGDLCPEILEFLNDHT
jgi:acetyl esterase/lipase